MKSYRIRDGFSVRFDDRTVLQGGDVVELDDDAASMHAHKLEEYSAEQAAAEQAAAESKSNQEPERKNK